MLLGQTWVAQPHTSALGWARVWGSLLCTWESALGLASADLYRTRETASGCQPHTSAPVKAPAWGLPPSKTESTMAQTSVIPPSTWEKEWERELGSRPRKWVPRWGWEWDCLRGTSA